MTETPIVNAHHHIGDVRPSHDPVFEGDDTVEQLIAAMDEHHVDATFLMPLGGANGREVEAVHDQIYATTQRTRAGCSGSRRRIRASVGSSSTERWSGLSKTTTSSTRNSTRSPGVSTRPPRSPTTSSMRAARTTSPAMVHTGPHGMPFSVPGMLRPVAGDYPDLPIVLAHMGGAYTLTQEAIFMAERYADIYLDTTLALNLYVKRAMGQVVADRPLMAAEHSSNIPVALTKIRSIGASPGQEARILGGNAVDLYDLEVAKPDFTEAPVATTS